MYVINGKKNDTFADLEIICWKGNPYITETMSKPDGSGPLKFRIGPNHFINQLRPGAYVVPGSLEIGSAQGDELVYDLYTGTGTIANFVCSPCKKSDRPGVRG